MPTLRILADGTWTFATPGQPDRDGIPLFRVGSSDVVIAAIDYTAWLGSAAVSNSAWSATNATLGSPSTSGAVASVLVTVPAAPLPVYPWPVYWPQPVTLKHIMTADDGRMIHITMRLLGQPR